MPMSLDNEITRCNITTENVQEAIGTFESPQGEMEEKLADILLELLNADRISRHDNFFALGGDSLLILRLLAQLRAIGLDTTVQEVFDAPTLATLASTLTQYHAEAIPPNLITVDSTKITPEMLLLISLSQADIDKIIVQVPGGIANIQDIYGLTPLQNGILFQHLMAKEGDPYLLVSQLSFTDRSSLECYADALQKVIERHDILRTAFIWEGLSEPAQVVLRQASSLLTEITLNESDKSALQQLGEQLNSHRSCFTSFQFELTHPPLLRLLTAPEADGSWVALQLMNNLIMDRLALKKLQTEIHAIANGKIELLTMPTPFRNFVAKTRLGIIADEHENFFIEMLGDIDEPTLPFGLSDIGFGGTQIDEIHISLPQPLNDQLRMHARNLRVSLASICHLAWAQVLSKASGREAILFGTVLLGRLQTGDEYNTSIGPMNSTLPLRLDVDDRSVKDAVRHTHDKLSALLAHEHASLVLAQRCCGVPTNLPLFSALLNYHHNQIIEEAAAPFAGVNFADVEERPMYPLTMSVEDSGVSLGLNAQITLPLSAKRICAYMQQSLESLSHALAHKPEESVRKMTVMPPDERSLLLHSYNQTTDTHSSICCLHQLFEAQVENNAMAIAVECDGKTLSYSELNRKANQLAHYLISKGSKPDERIALCAKRSSTIVIAILGILKSGCAYVPLDPAYPSQRLTNILRDSNPICLLADDTGRQALGDHQVPVVDLDTPLPPNLPIDNPDSTKIGITPAHLAYIIYTSGSTGTPKGVMLEHRNAAKCLYWINKVFTAEDFKHTSFSTSVNFDMSLYECFSALSMGTTLHVYPNVLALTKSANVSMVSTVPSAIPVILNADSVPLSLKNLHFIGEPLTVSLIKRIMNETQVTQICNLYGLTETTFLATMHRFYKHDDETIVTIGRPLGDTRVYLLDAHGELVLPGAVGEIYIGGGTVGRGYLNHPELTAERFLPDKFSTDKTARMCRTGDCARYLPDGNLMFLGRADQQVKIRGIRIELGEIEARLVEHPNVRAAVVQSYKNGFDTRLIAYVVVDTETFNIQSLRTYLLALLPDYMVPAAYMRLPSLPQTPNGKLDRRALPTPDDDAFVRQDYVAPQGKMEEKLADIWHQLLNVDRIGRHDNFFELGGHSLLVVGLLDQLRNIGLDTSVKDVFDAPTLATLASTLARYDAVTTPPNMITESSTEITPEMLPLITLTQADIDSIVAQVAGGLTNIQDIYGLSPLQDGLLFHHLMSKVGDPFLLEARIHFNDRTSLEHYVDAVELVIKRHDILRTAIFWDGLSEPAQVVLRKVPSILTEITLTKTDETVLEQLSHKFGPRHYKMDLSQAPLLRLLVASTSTGNWMALQLMHHTIIDNSTHQRMQAEIHAIMDGNSEMLKAPSSFRHFVAQIQARLKASTAEHTRFFTEMLGDIDEPTLPFGLSNVDGDETDMSEAYLQISQTLYDQLRMHARKLRVSLASICHLAWAQLIARASERTAVVFGTVLFGRFQAGEDNSNTMGPMINTLPVRLDVDERSVEDAIRHTHARLSALLAHEYAPLVLAQRCSAVPTSLPLFSALLNYRHQHSTGDVFASLPGVSFLNDEGDTNYPLAMSLDDDGNSLCIAVVSSISSTRICAYMQQALESLADALTHSPQISVRKLEVMPPEERKMLLHDWNQPSVTRTHGRCLHQLFEAQVESDGMAIAVECDGKKLSYSELNSQANQLAHYLIARGVQPDDLIALCVERSLILPVAILGILKAGCAYVPLDPAYPSERLTNILVDAAPKFLVADAYGRKSLGAHQVPVIDLEKPLPTDLSLDNPDIIKLGLTPAHLAYIIYTSGSTGKPKGVMVEHRQVVRLFDATRDQFNFKKHDNWCMFHSFSFDFSIWEIWGALSNGSQLSIVPHNIARSTDEFYDWICTNGITVLCQTPSAFKMLIRVIDFTSKSDRLRYVIFGGEELDPLVAKELLEKYEKSGTILVNMYGITETTVHATFQRLESVENCYSIGRPIADLRVYLLDSQREPVLLGAEGELYIGGAGVARGYLNRSELTAERFLSDPFITDSRMYRTGDKARYLPDGNLVFLGRIDQQVKIRGFRIELGEIEARLVEHHQVHEAVVQLNGKASDARLVAYVVADAHADSSVINNLRTYLSNLLPNYMVPAAYVCLPSIPLTHSGKLDRNALPAPDDGACARQQYEAPQGEIEEKLAEIWRELLNIDRISRNDNFFELGGHSVLVIHFINKAKLYNMHINTRGVFHFPILKTLADQITNRCGNFYCDVAISVRRGGSEVPLFLLPDGSGDISYAFELAHELDKDIPVYVLPWPSPKNKQPASIEEMANTLISCIKEARPNGTCSIVGYSSGGILCIEIAKQLINSGYPVSFLGLIDTYSINGYTPLSETEWLLSKLSIEFPILKTFDDSKWYDGVIKLPLTEAIEEIQKAKFALNNTDIDWQVLLTKQRYNYQNMCAAYEIDSLPVKVHLFKAVDQGMDAMHKEYMDNAKKLGWENYHHSDDFDIIPIDGDHFTMMTDPKNRSVLGRKMTDSLKAANG